MLPLDSEDTKDAILIPKTDDGRVIFAIPWLGRFLVGTTDDEATLNDEMIVSTNAISPGTKRFELWRVGLKRMRTVGTMRTLRPIARCSRS